MKNKRQEMILNFIKSNNVETQKELADMLNASGFNVTQATVSRDIKKLNLVKVQTTDGRQKYAEGEPSNVKMKGSLTKVLADSVLSVEAAGNIIVVRTLSGMAMAAAATIDALKIPGIIGSIAGDDTIMCVIKDEKSVKSVIEQLDRVI